MQCVVFEEQLYVTLGVFVIKFLCLPRQGAHQSEKSPKWTTPCNYFHMSEQTHVPRHPCCSICKMQYKDTYIGGINLFPNIVRPWR